MDRPIRTVTLSSPPPSSACWRSLSHPSFALFIVVSIVLTPRLGTALTLATMTVGQMLAALVLDHYGWLGAPVIRLSLPNDLLGSRSSTPRQPAAVAA